MRWLGPLAAFITAAVGAYACTGDEELLEALGEGCLINSDCNDPLVCAFRRCHQQCNDNRDCPADQRCVEAERPVRVCLLPDEQHCRYNSECAGELVCGVDGACRNQCAADRDCVPEQRCVSGTCAADAELVDGGLVALSSGPVSGQPCSFTTDCPEPQVCIDHACRLQCLGDEDCNPYTCDPVTHRCISELECTPGEQVQCDCVGDGVLKGAQVCADDGLSYGPCFGCGDAG